MYLYLVLEQLCYLKSLGSSAYRNKHSPDGPCVNPDVLFSMNSSEGAVLQDKLGESHI